MGRPDFKLWISSYSVTPQHWQIAAEPTGCTRGRTDNGPFVHGLGPFFYCRPHHSDSSKAKQTAGGGIRVKSFFVCFPFSPDEAKELHVAVARTVHEGNVSLSGSWSENNVVVPGAVQDHRNNTARTAMKRNESPIITPRAVKCVVNPPLHFTGASPDLDRSRAESAHPGTAGPPSRTCAAPVGPLTGYPINRPSSTYARPLCFSSPRPNKYQALFVASHPKVSISFISEKRSLHQAASCL